MQDTELFLALAEIAGVFVGFGALIAVRSGGASGVAEVAYMRAVVSMGMLTVVAALAPLTLGRFDLTAHQSWALSSVLVLICWLVWIVAMARTPEYRANMAAEFGMNRATRSGWVNLVETVTWVVYLMAMAVTPIIIVLGVAPRLEAALYFAVVVLILVGAGWALLTLVFAQRGRASA
jgi:hypothetical protein